MMTRRSVMGTIGGGALLLGLGRRGAGAPGAPTAGAAPKAAPGAQAGSAPRAAPGAAGAPRGPASAWAGAHAVRPLPFAPGKLRGLSERLIVSHHDNNYGGAVRNLNRVEAELDRLGADAPGFVVSGLLRSQLTYQNSATLHEAYFACLGGAGKPGGPVVDALAAAFGGAARWEEAHRAAGMSLAGGSGWAIVAYDLAGDALRIVGCADHTQALAGAYPLLVLDMYEHAYHLDYGAAAAKYIDAFFANVQWDEVNRRFEAARKAAAALR